MRIYDVSLTVDQNLPVWPGDPPFQRVRLSKIEEGANANVSQITMGVHTGTHVDAPFHFLPDGTTVEAMPLDVLVGPALVVQLPEEVDVVNDHALAQANIPKGATRLLLKTRSSEFWSRKPLKFETDFVGIDASGADYLVERGVELIGIDYLSIAPYKHSRPTHEKLLGARMVIIEGLDLREAQPGQYMLYCLPVKLGGSDGAPARVILIQE
jgi:arylformamidase